MSKTIAAISSLLALATCAAAAPSAAVMKDWQDQYSRLEKLIAGDARKQAPASQMLDAQALILDTDRAPLDVVLRRAEALLKHLKTLPNAPGLGGLEGRLAAIKARPGLADKDLFFAVKQITREAMLANPLVDFDAILYCERKNLGKDNWGGDHMATVYFGHTQAYGGGLYIVRNIKSDNPEIANVLADSVITSGRWTGQRLTGGAVVSPELSFDGREILFAYAKPAYSGEKRPWEYTEENSFHIFKVNVDGSRLVQLTEGNYNDFDPCYLPNGRIAFVSTRTTGRGTGPIYPRCFPDRAPRQHFLHSMKADGSDIIPLSYHETDEWNPSVTNDGMIVYTRWDYVDRNSNAAQHLWTCYPDGRDPRGPHGNYVHPFSTMEGGDFGPGVFTTRPCCEWHIRAVPKAAGYTGSSLFVACAGPHHGQPFGPLVLIDTSVEDDGLMSQVKRITPNRFPESEIDSKQSWDYGAAWPLSGDYYVVNYLEGLYLLDRFGNVELICKARNPSLRPTEPMPLKARTMPPVIPTQTFQGENATPDAPAATIRVLNAYDSDLPFPKGTKLKELRIIQYFPKSTEALFTPKIGYAEQSLARMVLGTVPVEADGSISFEAPVGKAISFQLLDDHGMAIQAMRSVTYVHPGEQLTCVGCHESKWQAPDRSPRYAAMRRPPSPIVPDVGGAEPMNFHRLVKPVLDAKCTPCHQKEKAPPDMSYASLQQYAFYLVGGKPTSGTWLTIPRHGGSRSVPGKHGAYGAPLLKYLDKSHHGTELTAAERRRITMWLDCNSNELGDYENEKAQREGQLVWPLFDVNRDNVLGVETPRPAGAAR